MVGTTEAIWEELHAGLWQFIRKRVRDQASAEDILQDIFLKVHERVLLQKPIPAAPHHKMWISFD